MSVVTIGTLPDVVVTPDLTDLYAVEQADGKTKQETAQQLFDNAVNLADAATLEGDEYLLVNQGGVATRAASSLVAGVPLLYVNNPSVAGNTNYNLNCAYSHYESFEGSAALTMTFAFATKPQSGFISEISFKVYNSGAGVITLAWTGIAASQWVNGLALTSIAAGKTYWFSAIVSNSAVELITYVLKGT